jgi:hypothetical protein
MTTDRSVESHRRMADQAYELKKKYSQTFGMSKKKFIELYEMGEVQLSTVYENLFVAASNYMGDTIIKVSVDRYDFMRVSRNGFRQPIGDMKTTTVQKHSRNKNWSYRINNVYNKLGNIFIVGYDRHHDKFHYFSIPYWVNKPKTFMEIPINFETGEPSETGKYSVFECASFEDMVRTRFINPRKIAKVWRISR